MPWDWIINLQKVSTYSVFQKDSASDPAGEDSSGLPASTQMKQKRQWSLFRARTGLPCPRPLDEAEDAAMLFPSSNGVVGWKQIAWARWRSTCPRRRSNKCLGATPDQSWCGWVPREEPWYDYVWWDPSDKICFRSWSVGSRPLAGRFPMVNHHTKLRKIII
jgi:hypothetical protein